MDMVLRIGAAAAALVVACGVAYIAIPSLAKIWFRRRFLARVRNHPAAFITFDDGPDALQTPRILDTLRAAGVKATFFVCGANVERYPELVARIIAEGHALGEHGYAHYHPWKTGPVRTLKDFLRAAGALTRIGLPARRRLFRPPYGKLNLALLPYVVATRRRAVFWNLNPRDYERTAPEEVVERVLPKLGPGTVLLLHDGRPNRPAGESAVTAAALAALLARVDRTRLRFATIDELFAE
jgi:peptidoglycan-N-acetylglucosamine deacetylase